MSNNNQQIMENPYVANPPANGYNPYWRTAINTVLGAAPGLMAGNPYLAIAGATTKGIGTWDTVNAYNKAANNFKNYKNTYSQDPNIPNQIKPYIQNSNSYDQINNVMGKLAPQLGSFNMSNGMTGQLNGQTNSQAFPTDRYVDPKEMQTYIDNTEMGGFAKQSQH